MFRRHGLRSRDEGAEESIELMDIHRPAALASLKESIATTVCIDQLSLS
jgi:hypothetical protein